jgi:formate C-acetyltransferase
VVFERRTAGFAQLLDALSADFVGHEALLAEILGRVPRFGSGGELPNRIARDIVDFVYRSFQAQPHYRGGRYLPGYWSMSNHVAFGMLSGALPSGRRRGKAFSPGLTPTPLCRSPLTEQMRTVASLEHLRLPNNFAFNVKLVPSPDEPHAKVLDRMTAYVGAYAELGGMQIQFNVVSTALLRDAVEHPDEHRDLLVRISGYNAYFVELNRDMQQELIERTEHRLGGS